MEKPEENEVLNLNTSKRWGLYWSLRAAETILKWTELEMRTCPVEMTVSPVLAGVAGAKVREVQLEGKYQDKTFSTRCVLEKEPGKPWKVVSLTVAYPGWGGGIYHHNVSPFLLGCTDVPDDAD